MGGSWVLQSEAVRAAGLLYEHVVSVAQDISVGFMIWAAWVCQWKCHWKSGDE